jgi:GTP-binding protein
MVVDARSELASPDIELARLLRTTGKPLFLAVNKVDSEKQAGVAEDFRRLGIQEMFPVSAEHGRGVDDLLDGILSALREKPLTAEDADKGLITEGTESTEAATGSKYPPSRTLREGSGATDSVLATDYTRSTTDSPTANDRRPATEIAVAIIGHPNVGKSTLLNRLTGSERAIVSPVPGTTRDAVDEVVRRDGKVIRFIDTAGIRRKGKTHLMAEKLSVVMARKHLEAADIALLVIDATEGVSALDAAIAGYAHESGRSLIVVVNKWDLVTSGQKKAVSQSRSARIQEYKRSGDRAAYEQRLRYALKFLSYAPVLFISAANGKGTEKIFPTLEKVAAERRKRITTGEMNRFLKHVDFDRASVPVRQRVKILYLTQAAVAPPTFVFFTDRQVKLHFSYQRFLENQIRRAFGFAGTPIWIKVRARE